MVRAAYFLEEEKTAYAGPASRYDSTACALEGCQISVVGQPDARGDRYERDRRVEDLRPDRQGAERAQALGHIRHTHARGPPEDEGGRRVHQEGDRAAQLAFEISSLLTRDPSLRTWALQLIGIPL